MTPPQDPAFAPFGVEPAGPAPAPRRTQAQLLIELAEEASTDLFRDDTGGLYATVPVDDHWETWPIGSRVFKAWLRHRFYAKFSKPPTTDAVVQALSILEARAQFDGQVCPVFVRVGATDGTLFIDLGDPSWRAIEVTPFGWEVVPHPAVKFHRGRGTMPLPIPLRGGTLLELWEFINVGVEERPLVATWLAAALLPTGPYPVLVLQGEQGSAKSTAARLLRALVDPSVAPLRSAPRDERDLMITAKHNWILSFDNFSHIAPWLSDAFCRLATGGGYSTRELWTDAEETIFTAQRPIILNGIEELAERDDLRDRALIVNLPPLSDGSRRDEAALFGLFDQVRPLLLGALLEAVSEGLGAKVTLPALPRMADFASWAVSCEQGLGLKRGSFLRAYLCNRQQAVDLSIEFNPVAQAMLRLADGPPWEGTATELLTALNHLIPDADRMGRDWPASARLLSNKVRRAMPALRNAGVEIGFDRERRRRMISVRRAANASVTSVTDVTAFPSPSLVDYADGEGGAPRSPPLSRARTPLDNGDAGDGRGGASAAFSEAARPEEDPDNVTRAALRDGL